MPSRKVQTERGYSVCGRCHRKVDINAVLAAVRKHQHYACVCGKTLNKGEDRRMVEDVR